MLPKEFLMPRRTYTGEGCALRILAEAAACGNTGLLVCDQVLEKSGMIAKILANAPAGLNVTTHAHAGREPTTAEVDALRATLRGAKPAFQWIAAVGGGSVLDLAKGAAALADAAQPAAEFLTNPLPVPGARVPLFMAPSTAGTGSEATVVSVMIDPERGLKTSIRSASVIPQAVFLDPAMLASCPPRVIGASGLDAFVQAVESYTSRNATDFTRLLSGYAAQRVAESLSAVFHGDMSKAGALCEGSFLAGVALSHARLGLVHGLAHPLGSRWAVPHGLTCALCFPPVLRFNRDVSRQRMAELAALIGGDVEARVRGWLDDFALPNAFAGQTIRDREAIIKETLASGSTKANPRDVTAEEVSAMLDEIFAPV